MPNFISPENKLFRYLGGLLFIIIFLALYDVYAEYSLRERLEQSLYEATLAEASIGESNRAVIAFKTQIQEWQSLLLRGQNPADYTIYLAAFQAQHTMVQEALNKTYMDFARLGFNVDLVKKAQQGHAQLLHVYLDALKLYNPADPKSMQQVGNAVRGIDRPVERDIQAIVWVVNRNLENRHQLLAQSEEGDKYSVGLGGLLLIAAIVAALILQSALRANQQIHDSLRQSEANLIIYSQVFLRAMDAAAITDAEGGLIDVNPAYEKLIGITHDAALGKKIFFNNEEEPQPIYQELWSALNKQGFFAHELMLTRADGELFPCWVAANRVNDTHAGRYFFVLVDITKHKSLQRELEVQAFHEPLTNLPNRTRFSEVFRKTIASVALEDKQFALLFVDLDQFKAVNDTQGHDAGDQLLKEVASRLRRCVGPKDLVARLGGDEFVVLVNDFAQVAQIELLANNILSALLQPFMLRQVAHISASIGISLYPQHGLTQSVLMKNADIAMYAAKQAGKNTYKFYVAPTDL
jgi:diguanylate cyclase (GGDEF)-like protein/PAS domain S-box-containing protein